mmetsp:Transcript_37744/g.56466  ORF Transcript_37744/g.56466 Transcript_37744/m.56466 type:complete len:241 (-) Transcript_37744:250-972(-)
MKRESTKDALHQSRAVVEQSREKVTSPLEREKALEQELEILRAREQKWKRRCDEQMVMIEMMKRNGKECAQTSATTANVQECDPPATADRKKQRNNPLRSSFLRSIIRRRPSLLAETKPEAVDLMDEPEPKNSEVIEPHNDAYWLNISQHIVDSVISPNTDRLEMEAELAIYLKKIDENRQKHLADVLGAHKIRMEKKKEIIEEQREKINEYKKYIAGLTSELERVYMEQDESAHNFYQK